MFEFILGWRKASKCKKLIRKVQCRLNLLKNKRCCIVRQLRNDVAQLIKHGHYQTAFNRVDQIYKDECIVTVYDLLAHFSEFISLQLSYIRRHKDCPNDINEAISSLIFASARCGDVPELVLIRKLFSERYGQSFEAKALELLPGNLVNFQIRENLSIKLVPNEVKYKLVKEIATTVLQTGPLALEFTSEQHQQEANKTNANQVVQGTETEQIAHVDFSSNRFDFDYSTVEKGPTIVDRVDAESSSGNSTTSVPEEIVYLDDVEEFHPPLKKDEHGQDQRVFVFRSSIMVPMVENRKMHQFNDFDIEQSEPSWNEREVLRRSRESRKISRKRLASSAIECAIDYKDMSHRQRSSHEKIHYEGTVKKQYFYSERPGKSCCVMPRTSIENMYYEKDKNGVHCSRSLDTHLSVTQIDEMGVSSGYTRAMTMPCERMKEHLDDNVVLRSNSFPIQPTSPHVHPKLPDYDELAAKFMALKKQNLQNRK